MDTYILSQPTRSGNSYWLSNHKNLCGLAHPQLMNPASQDEYYYRKRQYLIKHMVANDYVEQHSARLTADMIRNKVVNLKQLVFEVTDSCNLRCKYCGYGDLYEGYDIRRNSKMTREQVQPLFDYLVGLWTQMPSDSYNDGTKISFYGGEPLLNMPFIKSAVSFFKNLSIHGKQFSFSMTSNAILLDRHIDFLAENEFSLLISLDGNRENHSYRVDHAGKNSFDKVIKNVNSLRQCHPDYFEKHVNFNAVLHNQNSVESICSFIREKFGKTPMISELNNVDILPENRAEFDRLYKNWGESLHQSEHYEELERTMFMSARSYKDATSFLHQYSGYVYRCYNDLLYKREKKKFLPTGTCMPFGRKLFVTVNGKILACERINQKYELGRITDNKVLIDYEAIANKYNGYFDNLQNQCERCYNANSCFQCIFQLPNIDSHPKCHGYIGLAEFSWLIARNLDFLEGHRDDYMRLMKDVVIE